MRRVSTENGQTNTPTGDLGSQLVKLLSGLEDIKKLKGDHSEISKHMHDFGVRLKKLEMAVAKSQQYQKDHDELHRNMAKAHGTDQGVVQKQIATMVAQHTKTMQDTTQAQVTTLMTAITTLQVAIEEFTNKKVEVNVGQPEQTIAPEPKEKRYKIVRNQNGLMDEIVERNA